MKGVRKPLHTGRRPHGLGRVCIRCLAPYSRGTFPVPGRGGGPAGGDAPQVRGGAGPGPRGAASPLRPPRRRAPSRRPECPGGRVRGQGGLGPLDHAGSDRQAALRPDAEVALRLVPRVGGAERVDVLPRLCVVRGDPAPRADARGAGEGRPRKGERPVREPTRLERQLRGGLSTAEMVAELPKACDVGTKRNAKGYRESWRGYKMHRDAADGDIPVSGILTSASLHDSQAAIPLTKMTAERIDHCYELMDAADDSREIGAHAQLAGRVAIIDANPRRDAALKAGLAREALAQRRAGHVRHDRVRYRQRSSVERVNSALKDSYGGRHVRVRGNLKAACHLFFGVLALTVHRLMRLTI